MNESINFSRLSIDPDFPVWLGRVRIEQMIDESGSSDEVKRSYHHLVAGCGDGGPYIHSLELGFKIGELLRDLADEEPYLELRYAFSDLDRNPAYSLNEIRRLKDSN